VSTDPVIDPATAGRKVLPEDSICLYCGSSRGHDPRHAAEAEAIGAGIAERGWRLVYGAGDLGLMGIAARAAQARGGRVLGVIPRHLLELEVAKSDLDTLVLTETMHERKKLMLGNAAAVVALAGGIGTLDELIEVLTWRQLGLHAKPVLLVNAGGYWDPLLALFDHMEASGYLGGSYREGLTVVASAAEALDTLSRLLPAAR
jgi:hypothetical protein